MFELVKEWGHHKIYKYNSPFIDFFKNLYNTKYLDELHNKSNDYNFYKNNPQLLDDRETDLHKQFYENIKTTPVFKELYCNFIKDIYKELYPEEQIMIYQSFPSIRFQFDNSIAIPPHCDSDNLACHPLGEINFIIPITRMFDSNTIFIESEPGKKDFEPVTLETNNLFHFNGNTCTHYNERNKENKLRISLDFRILKLKDYINYIKSNNITNTNPRNPDGTSDREPVKMLIGGYYQSCLINDNIDKMTNWYLNVKDVIMQHRPTFGKEEAESTYKYMLEDNFITEHKKTEELENMICKYLNCKHCLMTTSGTTAIILALMALELNHGDKVIVPNYTMIATINCVKLLGLEPVIIDIDSDTYTLNYEDIKDYKNIKAILHVSLNNRYKKIEELVSYCKKNNIYLIEDSARYIW